jgi:hypothetical protein
VDYLFRRHSVRDFKDKIPQSWICIDCGMNTAPGLFSRGAMEAAIAALGDKWEKGERIEQEINDQSEVYTVRDDVWKAAKMEGFGGCLCIGCLEKRLGRQLHPKDFKRNDPFNDNSLPGTPRLLKRRGRAKG